MSLLKVEASLSAKCAPCSYLMLLMIASNHHSNSSSLSISWVITIFTALREQLVTQNTLTADTLR